MLYMSVLYFNINGSILSGDVGYLLNIIFSFIVANGCKKLLIYDKWIIKDALYSIALLEGWW
jgi:hypothetical protein